MINFNNLLFRKKKFFNERIYILEKKSSYIAKVGFFLFFIFIKFSAFGKIENTKNIVDKDIIDHKKTIAAILFLREKYRGKYKLVFKECSEKGLSPSRFKEIIREIREKKKINISQNQKLILKTVLHKIKFLGEEFKKLRANCTEELIGINTFNIISRKLKKDSSFKKRYDNVSLVDLGKK